MTGTLSTSVLPAFEPLSLAQQVAQMVVVRASGHLFDHEIGYPDWEADSATLRHYLQDLGVGGVILLGGSAAEVGLKTQALQAQAAIPLLMAADIEEGVGQRFSGATWFPPPMALGAIANQDLAAALGYAEAMGAVTAQEARAIGLNWVLAPVVDINNNPQNPVINVRAFSHTADQVTALAGAFIQGARRQGVLTTAKHFPGHGDTATDSHLALPILPHSLDRLHQLELVPFVGAIAVGVDAVMTAHVQIPALDGDHPATLSAATLTGLLRQRLGFTGLIVTDALVMGAITHAYGPYEAAVLAVAAGADVVLMPADPEGVIHALVEAVTLGRIPPERILASLGRIWRAKQRVATPTPMAGPSPHAWEHLPPPPVQLEALAQPAARRLAATLLTAAMTTEGTMAPATATAPGHNLVIVDNLVGCGFLGRTAGAITLPEQSHYQLQLIDHQGCQRLPQAADLRPSLVQLFIRGHPFRGSADAAQLATTWVTALLDAGLLRGLVIYGSPYALAQFQPLIDRGVPYGFTYGQMPMAQTLILRALFRSAGGSEASSLPGFTD
ncbi:MAG: glycoside hydrolase family 3 N-terminal domain-containing protein [Nodosilinea sp.]